MSGGLTVEQLARSNPMRAYLGDVLHDEARLGHLVEEADGTWRVTPDFAARYSEAFGCLALTTPSERTPGVPEVSTPW